MTPVHRRAFFASAVALVVLPPPAAAKSAKRNRKGVGWLYGLLVAGSLLGAAWSGSRDTPPSDSDEHHG